MPWPGEPVARARRTRHRDTEQALRVDLASLPRSRLQAYDIGPPPQGQLRLTSTQLEMPPLASLWRVDLSSRASLLGPHVGGVHAAGLIIAGAAARFRGRARAIRLAGTRGHIGPTDVERRVNVVL